MYYVYLIRSIQYPDRIYIGNTENIQQRLETHNSGGSIHTKTHRPWEIISLHGFKDKLKATAFEKYLKCGSGHAFAKKKIMVKTMSRMELAVPAIEAIKTFKNITHTCHEQIFKATMICHYWPTA